MGQCRPTLADIGPGTSADIGRHRPILADIGRQRLTLADIPPYVEHDTLAPTSADVLILGSMIQLADIRTDIGRCEMFTSTTWHLTTSVPTSTDVKSSPADSVTLTAASGPSIT